MLHSSTDAHEINAVINHPSVRPFVGFPDAGGLDITPLLQPENLFPFGEHGGFALIWSSPRAAEVHTFILPSGRGRWARAAAAEGIAMARDKGFVLLWTKVAPNAPYTQAYAEGMGMKLTGEVIGDHRILAMGTA